jgi:hypothetical protein
MASETHVADPTPMAEVLSPATIAPQLTVPLLVVGAGNDLIEPPGESLRLYRGASGPEHLLPFEDATHIAISNMPEWTACLPQCAHGIANERHASPIAPRSQLQSLGAGPQVSHTNVSTRLRPSAVCRTIMSC